MRCVRHSSWGLVTIPPIASQMRCAVSTLLFTSGVEEFATNAITTGTTRKVDSERIHNSVLFAKEGKGRACR